MINLQYDSHEEFINFLFTLGDKKYKEFSCKIAKSKYEMIGIKLPVLKEIAKAISNKNLYKYFDNCKFNFYEEIMIYGFLLKYLDTPQDVISYFKIFVDKIDSWAFTDSIIADLKIVKNNKQIFTELINYLFCEKEFYVRSGYVFLMDYYLTEEYLDFVIEKLNLDYDYYYVNMAKAWLLSVLYLKNSQKTLKFLQSYNNDFVVNKTISKIKDSYRVSKIDKQKLSKYKR